MDGSFGFTVESEGSTFRVTLRGALDAASVPEAERRLVALAGNPAAECVCLDLSGVTFIDSTGLAMLVRLARSALRDRVDFDVVAMSGVVEEQFDRTRLRSLLVATPPRRGENGTPAP